MLRIRTTSVDQTRDLGAALAALVRDGDLLLLTGDLGAGKTALVQGIGRGLLVADRITSPTFTLLHHHEGRLPLHHVDAYRLGSPAEVFELGLPEILDDGGVMVVEWGEVVVSVMEHDHLEVKMMLGPGPDDREIGLAPVGRTWVERQPELHQLAADRGDG